MKVNERKATDFTSIYEHYFVIKNKNKTKQHQHNSTKPIYMVIVQMQPKRNGLWQIKK